VEWNFQKEAIKNAVRNLEGVKVLTNDIRVQPKTTDEIEEGTITMLNILDHRTESLVGWSNEFFVLILRPEQIRART